jgi:tetratricopeptide (TPR) repeat protein
MLAFMRRSRAVFYALLVLLTAAVYGRACSFDFVAADDGRYVVKNTHVLGGLNVRSVKWAFTTHYDGNWIPLTWMSLMGDASLYGPYPGGFHLTNILLHILNVLLVFGLFTAATGSQLRSAFVAALFAVHPLHVESVAFISERKDVLSIFCGLLALRAYVCYAQRQRLAWFFASICLFLCSLLAKQTLVTLPCLLLLLDFWPLGRLTKQNMPQRLFEKVPFALVTVVFCIVAYRAQAAGGAILSWDVFPLSQRLLNAVAAYGLYLWKLAVPVNLAFFYPHPRALALSDVALPAVLLMGITVVALAKVRRLPFLFVGWNWFLGTLVPLIGIVQIGRQQMADRYSYFPAIGLYVAAAWSIPAVLDGFAVRRLLPALGTAVVGIYAVMAVVQVGYWKDTETLLGHSLAVTPPNEFTEGLIGTYLVEQGRLDDGLRHLRRAVELAPHDVQSRWRLGRALSDAGRLDESMKQYDAALAIDEKQSIGHCQIAAVFARRGEQSAAIAHFKRAIELDAACTPAYLGLAEICRANKDYAGAVAWNEKALAHDETLFAARAGIARALWAQGRIEEAMARLQSGRDLSPLEQQAYAELMAALAASDRRR